MAKLIAFNAAMNNARDAVGHPSDIRGAAGS
jgi:hypothetical protein